jgi:hypothetical protein
MDDIRNIAAFKSLISPFKRKLKAIEFLWQYKFCGNHDYAYLDCSIYILRKSIFEKIYIGTIEFEPKNEKGYYENVDFLAVELGKFAQEKFNCEIYFPSKGKIKFDFKTWAELEQEKNNGIEIKETNYPTINWFEKILGFI